MSSIRINGRRLEDIIAEEQAQARADKGAEPKAVTTERSGVFDGDQAALAVNVDNGQIRVLRSNDASWHVLVAHTDRDEVKVDAAGAGLDVRVRSANTITSFGNSFGDNMVIVNGRTISASSAGSVSIGGPEVFVEIALPAKVTYDAQFETASGEVRLEGDMLTFTRLRAKTGSGDVAADLTRARVERFRASAGSGDIDLALPTSAGGEFECSTGSGDIDLRAPAIISGTLHVSTGSGDKRVKHPAFTKNGDGRYEAVGAGPRMEIECSTGSGDVTVRVA